MSDPHVTQRLLMFEVYERDSEMPLVVSSDPTEARAAMQDGDRLVKRWWVAEGRTEE